MLQEDVEEEAYDQEHEEESREADSFHSYITSRKDKIEKMVQQQSTQSTSNPPPTT